MTRTDWAWLAFIFMSTALGLAFALPYVWKYSPERMVPVMMLIGFLVGAGAMIYFMLMFDKR